jgi:hypothetical protein
MANYRSENTRFVIIGISNSPPPTFARLGCLLAREDRRRCYKSALNAHRYPNRLSLHAQIVAEGDYAIQARWRNPENYNNPSNR